MKEYFDFSYGVLVYQDDVLLTAIKARRLQLARGRQAAQSDG
jgi:hypothetical protein